MITVTVTDVWDDTKRMHVIGSLAFSSNYTTAGDTINFAQYGVKSSSPPEYVNISGNTQYQYKFVAGTTLANGLVKIYTPTVELSQAAYPSAIGTDKVIFHAIFKKFQ